MPIIGENSSGVLLGIFGTLGLADLALAASAGGEVLLEAVTRCRNRLGQHHLSPACLRGSMGYRVLTNGESQLKAFLVALTAPECALQPGSVFRSA